MKRGKPKPSAAAAKRKGLVTDLQVAANVFAGLETRQRQPFGSALPDVAGESASPPGGKQ